MLAPEVPACEAAIPAVPLIPEPGRLSSAVPWEKGVEPPRCCLSLSFFLVCSFWGWYVDSVCLSCECFGSVWLQR